MRRKVVIVTSVLLTSSVLILVILLFRRLFRGKVANVFLYALWLVVAVRLLMPLPELFLEKVAGIEKPWVGSSVSVMNLVVRLASYWEHDTAGQFPMEVEQKNTDAVQPNERDTNSLEITENTEILHMYEKMRGWQFIKFSSTPLARIAGGIWLCGSLLLLCVQMLSEKRFRRWLTECREEITVCGQRAYKVRGISTPLLFRSSKFTLDIYIPEEIVDKEELVSHAVLHEKVHKKHGDIWWGYLRNLLVVAYWFHPLVWVAAICSKRDCEYACDSSVIGQMNREERISYGNSLLSLVQAGGEEYLLNVAVLMSIKKSELRKRIYLVKRGKTKGIAATVLAAVLMVVVGVSTFTGIKEKGNHEGKLLKTENSTKRLTNE